MITTFHESSWGATEMARPVGHSQMSSISNLIADSSSSRVFAGFFKRVRLFLRAPFDEDRAQPRLGGVSGLGGRSHAGRARSAAYAINSSASQPFLCSSRPLKGGPQSSRWQTPGLAQPPDLL